MSPFVMPRSASPSTVAAEVSVTSTPYRSGPSRRVKSGMRNTMATVLTPRVATVTVTARRRSRFRSSRSLVCSFTAAVTANSEGVTLLEARQNAQGAQGTHSHGSLGCLQVSRGGEFRGAAPRVLRCPVQPLFGEFSSL